MRFRAGSRTSAISNSKLVYRADEFSFDVEPAPVAGFTSILVNDLNLEVDDAGRVVSVWGACPYTQWKRASLTLPVVHFGEVFIIPDTPLRRGVSVRINPQTRWDSFADACSGWICVRNGNVPDSAIQILTGVVLETNQAENLCAIWLKPEHSPTVWNG